MENALITGVAHDRGEAKVTIIGVADHPGLAAKIFRTIADADIDIDMVVQNISKVVDGKTDITFTLPTGRAGPGRSRSCDRCRTRSTSRRSSTTTTSARCRWSVRGCARHPGVTATFCEALAGVGVNIDIISTSEIRISVLVRDVNWTPRSWRCTRRSTSAATKRPSCTPERDARW